MNTVFALSPLKCSAIEIGPRSVSIPGSSSPCEMDSPTSGPRCWVDQLQDISQGLQLICGSPSFSPTSPVSISPNFPADATATTSPKKGSGFIKQEIRRALSVNNPVSRHTRRPITVRHIETSRQLVEQLSAICGITTTAASEDLPKNSHVGNTHVGNSHVGNYHAENSHAGISVAQRHTWSSAESAVKETDTSASLPRVSSRAAALLASSAGIRLKVDVRSTVFDDLIVSVNARNHLTVHTAHDPSKVLLRYTLPHTVQINRLLCYVHGAMLLIQERQEEKYKITFVGTDCVYLPVVREDEIKRELTVVLHVPDSFEFKDLNVKTVDDAVIFTGNRDGSGILTPTSNSTAFSFETGVEDGGADVGSPPPSFQVTMQLPNGTDSRSVSAWLVKQNQVIVKGRLYPTSRSCTM